MRVDFPDPGFPVIQNTSPLASDSSHGLNCVLLLSSTHSNVFLCAPAMRDSLALIDSKASVRSTLFSAANVPSCENLSSKADKSRYRLGGWLIPLARSTALKISNLISSSLFPFSLSFSCTRESSRSCLSLTKGEQNFQSWYSAER